jgi:hypothetical protein
MNTQVKGRIRRIEIDEVTVLSRYSTPTSIQTRAIVRALQFYFLSFACPRTRDLLSIALSPKPFRHISVIVVSSIFFMAFHCLRVCESDPFRTRAGGRRGVAGAEGEDANPAEDIVAAGTAAAQHPSSRDHPFQASHH